MIKSIQCHVIRKFDNEFKFLVLKRNSNNSIYPNIWQVVTGKVKKGEKAYETALRESFEEIGRKPINFWHIPIIGSFYNYLTDKIIKIPIFAIEITEQSIILSDEHEDYFWAEYEECLQIIPMPSQIEGTQYLKKYIIDNNQSDIFKIKF